MLDVSSQPATPQLSLFTHQPAAQPCPGHLAPLPPEMLELFEQITGWVLEFTESRSSYLNRQSPSALPELASGKFSIVDMSANWPAGKPTSHRAKCDRFVELFDQLITELQQNRIELVKTRSQLEAYEPHVITNEDAILEDCFIPRHFDEPVETDQDFIVQQKTIHSDRPAINWIDDSTVPVAPPFAGWEIAGRTGYHDGCYVAWELSEQEQLVVRLGKIGLAGQSEDAEGVLLIDPLTAEVTLDSPAPFEFLILEPAAQRLEAIQVGTHFRPLRPEEFLIAATASQLSNLIQPERLRQIEHPEQLHIAISQLLDADERILVLHKK